VRHWVWNKLHAAASGRFLREGKGDFGVVFSEAIACLNTTILQATQMLLGACAATQPARCLQ
jgi:hypothetical protein